jgi:hypothetical protein
VTIGNDPGSLHKTNQIDLTAKRYGPLNYLIKKQMWLDTVNVLIGNNPGSFHKTNQIDLTAKRYGPLNYLIENKVELDNGSIQHFPNWVMSMSVLGCTL